jgi:hypothetical protein
LNDSGKRVRKDAIYCIHSANAVERVWRREIGSLRSGGFMMYKFCWGMWIGGTILIVASWVDIVSPTVGWVGFGVALLGTLLSFVAQQRRQQIQPRAPEINDGDQTPTT